MNRCSVVDGPAIEEGAVVLRVSVAHPTEENTGRVFICRMKRFGDLTVEPFPRGATPHEGGEFRAEAAEFANKYAAEHVDRFEELFEELARRNA